MADGCKLIHAQIADLGSTDWGVSWCLDWFSTCLLELPTNRRLTQFSRPRTHLEAKQSYIEQFSCRTYRHLARLAIRVQPWSRGLRVWKAFCAPRVHLCSRRHLQGRTPMIRTGRRMLTIRNPPRPSGALRWKSSLKRRFPKPKQPPIPRANQTLMTTGPTRSTGMIWISLRCFKPRSMPLACHLAPRYSWWSSTD